MIQLLIPMKFIRRTVKGQRPQKWHLVAEEGEDNLFAPFSVHWWRCGCGERLGRDELNPANYSNAHLRRFDIVECASLDQVPSINRADLCVKCWPYGSKEV